MQAVLLEGVVDVRSDLAVTPRATKCHCGRQLIREQPYPLESSLMNFCYSCAMARCDDSYGECPRKHDESSVDCTA
jgi:hypothetical protein